MPRKTPDGAPAFVDHLPKSQALLVARQQPTTPSWIPTWNQFTRYIYQTLMLSTRVVIDERHRIVKLHFRTTSEFEIVLTFKCKIVPVVDPPRRQPADQPDLSDRPPAPGDANPPVRPDQTGHTDIAGRHELQHCKQRPSLHFYSTYCKSKVSAERFEDLIRAKKILAISDVDVLEIGGGKRTERGSRANLRASSSTERRTLVRASEQRSGCSRLAEFVKTAST